MKRILVIAAASIAALVGMIVAAAAIQLARIEWPGEIALTARHDAPSRMLSRPLVLRRGAQIGADALEAHLVATGHRRVGAGVATGAYAVDGRIWRIGRRAFDHPDGHEGEGVVQVELSRSGRVASLRATSGEPVRTLRLEPMVIGTFLPPDGRDHRRVPLDDVPPVLVDAVLAIEDQRFHEHGGLDAYRIAGAMWANLRAGRVVQGGSTLTQQLVKNLYLSRERSLFRKLQEVPLALMLELRHTKQEILEAYLNEAYLGQSGEAAIHGVGRAAEHWFGRRVESLGLHEAALLAGMLRGPSLYSPRRDPETARARRDLVLAQMRALGMIDDAELARASASELGVVSRRRIPASVRYFTDHVEPALRARYGSDRLERGAMRIHTSLDPRLQRLAEDAVRRGTERLEQRTPSLVRDGKQLQAALVALDAGTGQLLAMVGGRSYASTQFNRAIDARRQPGSVFKTVAALAALTPYRNEPPPFTLATLVDDAPIALETPEGEWEPANHDEAFRGLVTLREVVEHSLNVPMIRVGMELGPRRVVRAARRLGIESPLRGVPSLVLGTSEVTLLEMTRAYGVLAAEGWHAELRSVLQVSDADGAVLERTEPEGSRTLGRDEAHLVTSLLRGVVDRGTGFGVRAAGFSGAVAGKTGTTDDYRDAWFIGYVPDLAVGVWVGFDDGDTLRMSGSRAALPIFADFLVRGLGPGGGRGFRVPPGVETATVVAAEGHPAGLLCNGDPEVFLEGTAPRERCDPWSWFTGRGVRRLGELAERRGRADADEAGGPPPVAAPPEARERRAGGLRIRLPRWLNLFRRDAEAEDVEVGLE